MSVFLNKDMIDMDYLEPIYENRNEKVFEDGSILYPLSDEDSDNYMLLCPDGRKCVYRESSYEIYLTKEELPDASLTVYGYKENDDGEYEKVIIYQKDADGNYVYNRYEQDYDDIFVEDFIATLKGNIKGAKGIEEGMLWDDIEAVYEDEMGKLLQDGSILRPISEGIDYLYVSPDGKKQVYRVSDSDEMLLTKEELPDGSLTVYDYKENDDGEYEKVLIYQKDADGNYAYNRYETDYRGDLEDLIETVRGNVADVKGLADREIFGEIEFVYENDKEKLLQDGSVLNRVSADVYACVSPDGKKREYTLCENELFLTKEELPDGSVTIFRYQITDEDEKKVVIYQKDADGNYVYNRYEQDYDDIFVEDFIETLKGNLKDAKGIEDGMLRYDIEAVYENSQGKFLVDGSFLSEIESDEDYLCTRPDGVKQVYHENDDGELYLTKEELPDGSLTAYDYKENDDGEYEKVLIYQKDANGNYIYHKYDSFNQNEEDDEVKVSLIVIEGNANGWTKKTYYDEKHKPVFYQKDGDERKKYYMSGVLKEEIREDGSIYTYYENGKLKSEKHADDSRKEYDLNGFCLYQEDEKGNYQKFKVKADEKGVLLLEKGDKYKTDEQYVYDSADRLIAKKIRTPKGMVIQSYFNDNEQKVKKEEYPDGSYTEYGRNKDYKRFDRSGNILEEANIFGRTTYTYYPDTKQIEQIHKYNESGYEVLGAYRHYDKKGNDNTKYWLARKKLIKERLDQEDEMASKKGIDRIKTIKKVSKLTKFVDHIKASKTSKSR